jgi:hypothetical protein
MSKLRFDPVTYQFYFRCRPEDSGRAKAVGFGWDPIRRRYYTEDPNVAVDLSSFGDDYVMELLADALGATTALKRREAAHRSKADTPTCGYSVLVECRSLRGLAVE